jgi:hypothetical protein
MLARLIRRLREAGVDNADALREPLLREQAAVNAAMRAEVLGGRRTPQVLKSARRAGLLEPDVVDALGLRDHPMVGVALNAK